MSTRQLADWMAYYDMADYTQSEMNKGDSFAMALEEWRAMNAIEEELQQARSRQRLGD